MKLCGSCETEKDESLFGFRKASLDGLSHKCKACQRVYDKARNGQDHRRQAREIYAQTEEGKISGAKAKEAWRKRNPDKTKAQAIVARAVRGGKLFRKPCEVCGINEQIHAHHDDYLEPLNVRWLCAAHHSQWHSKNGPGKNF